MLARCTWLLMEAGEAGGGSSCTMAWLWCCDCICDHAEREETCSSNTTWRARGDHPDASQCSRCRRMAKEECVYCVLVPVARQGRRRFENCRALQSLPRGLHRLPSLQEINIIGTQNIKSLPKEGLPDSLRELYISDCCAEVYEECQQLKGTRPDIRVCLHSSCAKLNLCFCVSFTQSTLLQHAFHSADYSFNSWIILLLSSIFPLEVKYCENRILRGEAVDFHQFSCQDGVTSDDVLAMVDKN